jgi:hypothetical protein
MHVDTRQSAERSLSVRRTKSDVWRRRMEVVEEVFNRKIGKMMKYVTTAHVR